MCSCINSIFSPHHADKLDDNLLYNFTVMDSELICSVDPDGILSIDHEVGEDFVEEEEVGKGKQHVIYKQGVTPICSSEGVSRASDVKMCKSVGLHDNLDTSQGVSVKYGQTVGFPVNSASHSYQLPISEIPAFKNNPYNSSDKGKKIILNNINKPDAQITSNFTRMGI